LSRPLRGKIRKPPSLPMVFSFGPERWSASFRNGCSARPEIPTEVPHVALTHVTAMSRHANTGQNTITLRKSGGPRINRITAGTTRYTTVKRLRFPLALRPCDAGVTTAKPWYTPLTDGARVERPRKGSGESQSRSHLREFGGGPHLPFPRKDRSKKYARYPHCGKRVSRADVARMLVSLREQSSGGRPRSETPRCPRGASTLRRAQARGFDCCRRAGVEFLMSSKGMR
jgi:hypothetical protein